MALTKKIKLQLKIQSMVSYFNFAWFGPLSVFLMRIVGGYRCSKVATLRKKVSDILRKTDGRPLIICSNHLTMIDSMLISWFLFDIRKFLVNFRLFPWNVPEIKNFGKNWFLRMMCYLGKCVYVERAGTPASKKLTLEKLRYLIRSRQLACIFPEGGRSRTGRIDEQGSMYGIGQLLQEINDCQVMCVYLRGDNQRSYSFLPKRGEVFYCDVSLATPKSDAKGRRGTKEITLKIVEQLQKMEQHYFASVRAATRHARA